MEISSTDDRYIILLALISRVNEAEERDSGFYFKVDASDRELALLKNGDRITVDGVQWGISSRNFDKQCFFLQAKQTVALSNGKDMDFRHNDPTDELVKEFSKWENLRDAVQFYHFLVFQERLEKYLSSPEDQKLQISNGRQGL